MSWTIVVVGDLEFSLNSLNLNGSEAGSQSCANFWTVSALYINKLNKYSLSSVDFEPR